MRINKFLFPLILLTVFMGVILLGMAVGFWETEGGGRHQRQSTLLDLPLNTWLESVERNENLWLL